MVGRQALQQLTGHGATSTPTEFGGKRSIGYNAGADSRAGLSGRVDVQGEAVHSTGRVRPADDAAWTGKRGATRNGCARLSVFLAPHVVPSFLQDFSLH